jgi:eukaryotic-like serine/threonine-protein kinase
VRGPVLERYEIVGELGQGGMSVVYRARDRQLARDVAVKVLHEFLARQPDARRRFHREAVAVAKLHHPGILEIFDYSGPDAKDTYIVTELIDGETLRDFIDRRGKLPYPELGALIVAELVRALRHAHEQSVIHRDLKPENVMLTKDGALKLMDFGLAQVMDGGTKLTATGTLLGSPAHMAPEVIDGKSSDARADIFSMGTILYWLTTGKLPFEAPNPSALFKKILDGKYEDPQVLEPKIGNGLARIIKKALEPVVDARYQDVTELHADLLVELEEVHLTPPEPNAKALLKDPESFARSFRPKLIATLAANGRQMMKERKIARAMDGFNRVIAIEPEHEETKQFVARLARRRMIARRARRMSVVAAVGLGLAAAVYGAALLIPEASRVEERAALALPERAPAERPLSEAIAGINGPFETAPVSTIEVPPEHPTPLEGTPADAKPAPKAKPKDRAKRVEKAVGAPPPTVETPEEDLPAPAPKDPPPKATRMPVVTVRVGHGFATAVFIDGSKVGTSVYKASYPVPSGRHLVEVTYVTGKDRPRLVEVAEDGKVFEVGQDGSRRELADATLDYLAPTAR